MKIAVLLRGFHFLARDRFGFPLDGRRYVGSLREQVLEPLRREHAVTVFAVTYPSPVHESLLAELGADRVALLSSATSSQAATFAHGLALIRDDPAGPFDRVICTRFDLLYLQPVTAWPVWERAGVFLPWREYEGFWRSEEKTGDFLQVLDAPWLPAFAEAVESQRGAHHLHGLYPVLRRLGVPVHFLAEGWHDSNTLYSNAECANPLYRVGNRPRLPLPNPARPRDLPWPVRFVQNRLSHLAVRVAAWWQRRRSGEGARAVLLSGSLLLLLAPALRAQNTTANEGGDLAFGGAGKEPGHFEVLEDLTFAPDGTLYVLDGVRMNHQTKQLEGNLRVEKFNRTGQLLGEINLARVPGPAWGENIQPQRIAADSAGEVFVSIPALGLVQQWDRTGNLIRTLPSPRAMALTMVGKGAQERLAVVPSRREVVPKRGWTWLGGDRIDLYTTQGVLERSIPLPQAYEDVRDVTADAAGNFYLKAEPNAIYKISPEGRLLHTWGGNPTTRHGDGSEVLHTVGVDSKGNVYTFAWGNPSLLTRFDADGQTVTQREGQFKWADPWGAHSAYTPLAVDPDDRVWVGATAVHEPNSANYQAYRAVPAIVRTAADFFAPGGSAHQAPLRGLGFRAEVKCGLPNGVSYEAAKPVPMAFTVFAAKRDVTAVTAHWRAFDALKTEVARGSLEVPLTNGVEANAAFAWTPPRYGAYFVQLQMSSTAGELGALGAHVAVTPRFPGLPELPAETGGWADAERQLWSGLPNLRIHPKFRAADTTEERAKKLGAMETQVAAAEKAGLPFLVQLMESQKEYRAEDVRTVLERFKGRLRYVEVCNEPNFTGSVDDYFKVHEGVYQLVKAIDPAVQVMGPATVNVDLRWLARLYELGFAKVSDIVSLHDYEGHESIDPAHWRWKFGEVRRIMAEHGDALKPVWQTERAIAGVRGDNFQGLVQAIRLSLHRDLLETLGIPSEHNFHYYLNQGGYAQVPSYVWSSSGPMPGALVLRTRHALTAAQGRKYAGMLDFGPTGNTLYLGVRYTGAGGETVVLRNLGAPAGPLEFGVQGTRGLNITDAWGNGTKAPVQDGKVTLELSQLPIYVQLDTGATLAAPRLDFGPNLAALAEISYTGATKSPLRLLNNGVVETYQNGDPNGDTDGAKIWQGELAGTQQSLELRFPEAQTIAHVILRTPRADNQFTTLLDFDLQRWDGQAWQTVQAVHRPMPPSEPAVTADATHALWMDDTCVFPLSFPPVTTNRLRIVVRQTTHGFVPDDQARAWGKVLPQVLMLREVEVYGAGAPTTRD